MELSTWLKKELADDVYGKLKFVKPASLLNHESRMDDEAIVFTCPADPVNAKPCDRDERYRELLNVDEAVEKRPLNPKTVVVEL